MDGTTTLSRIRSTFRTPVRILVPKLLTSRNNWKAKAHRRQTQLKAAKINIRDLSASRQRWRQQAEQLLQHNRQLQQQLQQAQQQLQDAQLALQQATAAQKK